MEVGYEYFGYGCKEDGSEYGRSKLAGEQLLFDYGKETGETEDLVTVMTCNEVFDRERPDTFGEEVRRKFRK